MAMSRLSLVIAIVALFCFNSVSAVDYTLSANCSCVGARIRYQLDRDDVGGAGIDPAWHYTNFGGPSDGSPWYCTPYCSSNNNPVFMEPSEPRVQCDDAANAYASEFGHSGNNSELFLIWYNDYTTGGNSRWRVELCPDAFPVANQPDYAAINKANFTAECTCMKARIEYWTNFPDVKNANVDPVVHFAGTSETFRYWTCPCTESDIFINDDFCAECEPAMQQWQGQFHVANTTSLQASLDIFYNYYYTPAPAVQTGKQKVMYRCDLCFNGETPIPTGQGAATTTGDASSSTTGGSSTSIPDDQKCTYAKWDYWNRNADIRHYNKDPVWYHENFGTGRTYNGYLCGTLPATYFTDDSGCECDDADAEYTYVFGADDAHDDYLSNYAVNGNAYHCELCNNKPFINGPYTLPYECTCYEARAAYKKYNSFGNTDPATINSVNHYLFTGGAAGWSWACQVCNTTLGANPTYPVDDYNCTAAAASYKATYPDEFKAYNGQAWSDPATHFYYFGDLYGFEWPSYLCGAPTDAPVTVAPTTPPTDAPTTTPTNAPTTAPTTTPTSSPTSSPTTTPTKSPTTAPSSTTGSSPTVIAYIVHYIQTFTSDISAFNKTAYAQVIANQLGVSVADVVIAINNLSKRAVLSTYQLVVDVTVRNTSESLAAAVNAVQTAATSSQTSTYLTNQGYTFTNSVTATGSNTTVPASTTGSTQAPTNAPGTTGGAATPAPSGTTSAGVSVSSFSAIVLAALFFFLNL